VVLTNRAPGAATIKEVIVIGPAAREVHVVSTDCTGAVLQAGASCSVQLRFTPDTIGVRSATLGANADVIAHVASLQATGLGSAIEWTLSALEFGDMVIANQTPAQDSSLRNIGNARLTILQTEVIDHATDFVITSLTPGITSLPPNGDLGFRIRFRPTATGNRQAFLRIHTDSPASPHVLSLSGVGFNAR
jgi:hypothetical protein